MAMLHHHRMMCQLSVIFIYFYFLSITVTVASSSARAWRLTNIIEPNPQAHAQPPRIYFLDTHHALVDNQIRQYHVAVVDEWGARDGHTTICTHYIVSHPCVNSPPIAHILLQVETSAYNMVDTSTLAAPTQNTTFIETTTTTGQLVLNATTATSSVPCSCI